MLQTKNSRKAFISFDALFSILPIVFMVSFIIQAMAITVSDAAYVMDKRENFNFLVATADYVVKVGAANTDVKGNLIPNWIDEGKLDGIADEIADPHNLNKDVVITTDEYDLPSDMTCIYRLIVVGSRPESGTIEKLYVCG